MKYSFKDELKQFLVLVIGMVVLIAGLGVVYIAGAYWTKALGLE